MKIYLHKKNIVNNDATLSFVTFELLVEIFVLIMLFSVRVLFRVEWTVTDRC